MSLADEIYEGNQGPRPEGDMGYDDELGLRVWDNIEYQVARALAIQIRDRISPFTIHQLHMRGDIVYYGNNPVAENTQNLYYYTESPKRFSHSEQVLFWKRLKPHLPRLDTDIIQISEHLFWNKKEGEVINNENCSISGGESPTIPSENVEN